MQGGQKKYRKVFLVEEYATLSESILLPDRNKIAKVKIMQLIYM